VIYEYGEPQWNDIERRKSKNSEKNLSLWHFVYHKSHLDWRGREPVSLRKILVTRESAMFAHFADILYEYNMF
jgi:hypothetical protein